MKVDQKQIPDEVAREAYEAFHHGKLWHEIIAAALAAWPNACTTSKGRATVHYNSLILPLPQEACDE